MGKILSDRAGSGFPFRTAAFWLGLVLLVAVAGAAYYWWASMRAKPQYVTAGVTMGDIERSVNVTGSINPRVTVQVGSYVSGTIKSLSCDYNTEVKAGQICAKIDPSTFQVIVDQNAAQLNSSRAQLRKDQAAQAYAKAVFERDGKLLKDGIVAQEIVDNDSNVFKQASAQLDLDQAAIVAQEASLKSAKVNLGYTDIVSPVTGTVLTRSVDVGQTVASSLQTPTLFLIGKDLTKMQVDANVSEADVGRIKEDQDVTFSVQAYPEKTFEGTVKQIRRGPITVQNVVTYDVVVAVDNPELLLFPGMTADAEIVTDSRENVLRIPLAAIRFSPERADRGGDAGYVRSGNRDGDHAGNHAGKDGAIRRDVASAWASRNQGGAQGEHRRGDRNSIADQAGEQKGKQDKQDQAEDKQNDSESTAAQEKSAASHGKHARVWVLRDGAPHLVRIQTGLDDGDLVEVIKGDLKAGDKVIVKEVRPVEAKSTPVQSPFAQSGGRRGGFGR
ncbi:Macrolide-specific efflux protein MacA [Collimonas arenae]|uniref:Macrolide-specific efflux protein MacA n=1 Tax=Collimonas arenae TaxID=279058 RepID=A0A0A1FG15_9BURK|nr:efflux RND transporter periplasmic adaptor subunit [Collimonas arenae]AIY41757.1 Macrolide-specific efflux protein MacA [Collimonas arenae]